jgi:hypothetical protein
VVSPSVLTMCGFLALQSAFNPVSASDLMALPPEQRYEAAVEAMLLGNIPPHIRRLVRVAGLCVMPDYVAVGTADDWMYLPLKRGHALVLAELTGMRLPTVCEVDDIWEAATVKLSPIPLLPTTDMTSFAYFKKHSDYIELPDFRYGALIAGHKKDVVTSMMPGKLAIYGWHRKDGTVIQPFSTIHSADYVDYSHGVRLVKELDR